MRMDRIEQIKARLSRATARPWFYDVGNGEIEAGDDRLTVCLRSEREWPGHAPDMELIEKAPDDMEFLLAAYAKAIAALQKVAVCDPTDAAMYASEALQGLGEL